MAPSLTLRALRNPHCQAQAALPTDDAFRLTGSDPAGRAGRIAGIAIRPIVGAFDIPGTRLAAGGVPVYPRGVLIRDRRLAAEMVAALGDRSVVLLRGHGLTSVTISVVQAVLPAISVDRLARLSLRSSVPTARSPICPAPTWPASAR
jgi:Class II Aldolase and Adducin N-terminal domain